MRWFLQLCMSAIEFRVPLRRAGYRNSGLPCCNVAKFWVSLVCRVISYWCMHRWGLWLVFLSDRVLWQKLSMSVIDVDRAV